MNVNMEHAEILTPEMAEKLAKVGRVVINTNLEMTVGRAVHEHTIAQKRIEELEREILQMNARKVLDREHARHLERVIRWALGESPDGMPEFRGRKDGEGQFYWRRQLAELAALPQEDEE